MTGFLLDTHVWIWFQRGDREAITEEFRDELLVWQHRKMLTLSAISAWELSMLIEGQRLEIETSVEQFLERALQSSGLNLAPLSTRILIESTRLPGELHRDPADRILVATARELGLTLVTRDKLLLAYAKQGHLNARKP